MLSEEVINRLSAAGPGIPTQIILSLQTAFGDDTAVAAALIPVGRYPCGRSARMEDDGDRPGRSRLVLGPGQVSVEDPADRVAGQVFQDGVDD
jgi:hypothetical protein